MGPGIRGIRLVICSCSSFVESPIPQVLDRKWAALAAGL